MAMVNIVKLSDIEGAKRIDAEYYQPEYLFLIEKLKKIGAIPLKIVAFPAKRKFQPEEGKFFDYIEIAEVDLNTGEFNSSKIIGEEVPDRAQWIIKKDDILISTVRPIRNAIVLIREEQENLVCSSGFCVVHPKNVSSLYLFLYFKTSFVAYLLDRYTTATEYPAVKWSDILNIPIYLGDTSFRKNISKLVYEAFCSLKKAKSFYTKAEILLLEELGLKDFKPEYEFSYNVSFSKTFEVHRIDPEYFYPVYENLIEDLIKKVKLKPLNNFLFDFQKGIEVGSENYQEEGRPFIRVSNISIHGFVKRDQKYLNEELYKKLKDVYEPKIDDILLTKDATPGIAYIVKDPIEGIISSGILKLNINKNKINKEYLVLCINSIVGRLQVERNGGGSVITHWKLEQIKRLQIPILSDKIQQKISLLIKKSHGARKKARQLLEEAKEKVETKIKKNLKLII